MNTKLTLTIKKRSQPGWLMWLIILLPFAFGTLNDLLGIPWAIRYALDIAWLVLLYFVVRSGRNTKETKQIALWVLTFLAYTMLVYVVQFQSPLYYLWGMRNNFRLFAAFLAFAAFLTPQNVEDYFKVFDTLFWVNVLVTLFQFFGLNLRGDYLGGIFGVEKGGNVYTNSFFLIVTTRDILFYLEKREKMNRCVLKILAALLIAALAELKFFFVEFVLIIGMAALFTRFTWRKFWVVFGGIGAVTAFAALLAVIFPNFEGFLSIDWFLETATSDKGYTSSGDLNRLNAIPQINELWLHSWSERLFGLGLGNCDTASYDFLNTPFFQSHGDMHYTWLSYAFMYLECGWIGLIFYFGFFVLVYFSIWKIEKRCEGIARTYCRMGRILAILCVLISVYNSSLRTEVGYMMFFALAVPFAINREITEMK